VARAPSSQRDGCVNHRGALSAALGDQSLQIAR
jgi:hypothetical protein